MNATSETTSPRPRPGPFRTGPRPPPPTAEEVREAGLRRAIGARVRARRQSLGLTMNRLGDVAGCSQSFLSKLEAGILMPSIPMLVRLAEALGDEPAAYLPGPATDA